MITSPADSEADVVQAQMVPVSLCARLETLLFMPLSAVPSLTVVTDSESCKCIYRQLLVSGLRFLRRKESFVIALRLTRAKVPI